MAVLLELDLKAMQQLMHHYGEPAFRAKQLREWLITKHTSDVHQMTNLSKNLRQKLALNHQAYPLRIDQIQYSAEDQTYKFTALTCDEEMIEVVVLKYDYGYSVCVSSQIGCAMGCAFCASAQGGLVRNCTATEMIAQVLLAEQIVNARIGRVVVMGMGEPLHNYQNLIQFLRLLNDPDWGLGISLRHVTVSTCGLVPQIRRLAAEKLPVTLALSLHAPDDTLRQKLMPIAEKYSLADVVLACRYYFKMTDRRISFEYILIKDVNDSPHQAKLLAQLLIKENAHVNLIPYNKVDFLEWEMSQNNQVQAFATILNKAGISVTIRRQLGDDIDAACGQLRRRTARIEVK